MMLRIRISGMNPYYLKYKKSHKPPRGSPHLNYYMGASLMASEMQVTLEKLLQVHEHHSWLYNWGVQQWRLLLGHQVLFIITL